MNDKLLPQSCEDFELLISCLIDGELDEASNLELQDHLSHCDRCGMRLDSFRNLNEQMRVVESVPPGFRDAVSEAVMNSTTPDADISHPLRRRRQPLVLWSLAAVAATILISLFVFNQRSDESAVGINVGDPLASFDPLASLNLINYRTELNQQSMLETCELDLRLLRVEMDGMELTDEQSKRFNQKCSEILARIQSLEFSK